LHGVQGELFGAVFRPVGRRQTSPMRDDSDYVTEPMKRWRRWFGPSSFDKASGS
jgi:hypothetical protein